jgi:NADH-quinone oxidoreductase subunit G
MSAGTAERVGATGADSVTISGPLGSVTLPLEIGSVVDGAVWVPLNSPGCHVYTDLGVVVGDTVTITAGGAA